MRFWDSALISFTNHVWHPGWNGFQINPKTPLVRNVILIVVMNWPIKPLLNRTRSYHSFHISTPRGKPWTGRAKNEKTNYFSWGRRSIRADIFINEAWWQFRVAAKPPAGGF